MVVNEQAGRPQKEFSALPDVVRASVPPAEHDRFTAAAE